MTDAELVVELTARRDYHRDQAERLDKAIEALEGDEAPTTAKAAKKTSKPKEGKQRPRPTGHGGRKPADPGLIEKARAMAKDGKSVNQIAVALGRPYNTVWKWLKA